MKQLVVISGKGGTGKTSITACFASLTHKVGCEIRFSGDAESLNPDNPVYSFIPDGGDPQTKNIAATENCNNCHDRFAIHGDGRFTYDYCQNCHNPYTRDQDYAELLRLDPPPPPDPTERCEYGKGLAVFCQALLARLDGLPPDVAEENLRWLKAELLDRYADFLTDTPPVHANAAGSPAHECIADVLDATVKAIRLRQRSLPPKPPPPPVPLPQVLLPQQVGGLFYEE